MSAIVLMQYSGQSHFQLEPVLGTVKFNVLITIGFMCIH